MPERSAIFRKGRPRRPTGIPGGLGVVLLVSFLVWLPGCASSEPVSVGEITGERELPSEGVRGRIRDLDPAVNYVSGRMDLAVVSQHEGEGGERVYRLLSVINEPVWVVVTSESGWDEDREVTRLDVRAKVGHFGDEAREHELVRRLSDRLVTLRERASD